MTDSLRLFLIEDDDHVALLIRKTLQRNGHEVTCCRTAADALIVLSQNPFDLVLLDQGLPDLSGMDMLEILAREGNSAPILMVTGEGDEHLASRVLRSGALDYIVKDPALAFLADLPKRVTESVTRHRLEQTNRLLIQALESARDGILITDVQGKIREVNQALERMTGYSRKELTDKQGLGDQAVLLSSVHPPEFYADLWRAILARNSWQGELTQQRRDGTRFDASLTISPLVNNRGRLTHFVGILRDNTRHKQLERQLFQAQKMQSVGTLAGGVAHEFNNLLAGINGYASLGLREPGLTPTLREFLGYVVDLSERAAELTRQLLAFARKPPLIRQPTLVEPLVRETVALVARTMHVDVSLRIGDSGSPLGKDEEGPPEALIVEGDSNQLQQALVNLALNARYAVGQRRKQASGESKSASNQGLQDPLGESIKGKFGSLESEIALGSNHTPERLSTEETPGGEVSRSMGAMETEKVPPTPLMQNDQNGDILFRLSVACLTAEMPAFPQNVPPGDYVLIEVEDRGTGMPPETLTRSLDPFFTTKEVGQGTGLGLPVVFGIVQGHHGYLTLTSVLGQGTCVRLYLPRYIKMDASRRETSGSSLATGLDSAETLEPDSGPSRSILVIDDEEAVLDVIRRFLEIAGHQVTCASSDQQALEALRMGHSPDLIVLDMMMPGALGDDSFALFHRLRQRKPGVPILLSTPEPQTALTPSLLKHPDVALIRKPFRMNELWYAVRQALSKEEGRDKG